MPDTIGLLARALGQMAAVLEQLPAAGLDAPTPCSSWTVRELLRHVVRQNLVTFAVSARGQTPDWSAPLPELGDGWLEDYRQGARELLETWRAADLEHQVATPGGAQAPLGSRADMQIVELAVHAWDLTRAASLPGVLDEQVAEHALAWSGQMLQPQARGEGKPFGAEVPVPADAPVVDRLAGWLGRDPHWKPPSTSGD